MGIAVEGARVIEAEYFVEDEAGKAERARWKTLLDVHRLLDGTILEEALPKAFYLLGDRHNLQTCSLALLDEAAGEVRVTAAVGMSGRARLQGRYRPGEGIVGQVVETGRTIIVPRPQTDARYLNRTGAIGVTDEDDERAFVCVPVLAAGRPIGAIGALVRSRDPNELNATADLLAGVAATVSQALRWDRASRAQKESATASVRIAALPQKADLGSLVGTSGAILSVVEQALQVAATRTTVLIRGESGTGKELIAELVHRNSSRAEGPFVKINCAALPESLIEAELFGHERGAFTGAHARRKGRFELAHRGTIFLDEIGEISLAMQAKLLRVLQEREFERVGGTETVRVDTRLIAATNKDLEAAIVAGSFREDLYYRINVFTMFAPPLRERKTDVLLLADHFVEKYARAYEKTVKRISTPAIDMLMSYHWPGNVRELENCIERAVVMCDDAVIHAHHLPPSLQTAEGSGTIPATSLTAAVAVLEREMLIDALKTTEGNQTRAAKLLQVSERIVNYKVRKYGIDCARFA
ncbi:MAG: sigma 54-interacting transcriptional regulator [Acidobacteriota bacterium]